MPRHQDALRESGDRRLPDADDRRVHAVAARRASRGTPIARPTPTIFAVVEGRGRTRIGDTTYEWGPRDIFVVPSWAPVSHEAHDDAVLFSLSDRPAQKALGLWREQVPFR